jgi:hypothetical protein
MIDFNMPQHNTHVHNATQAVVRVLLTDTNSRRSDQILSPGDTVCFPTPHGRNTLSVCRKSSADYSDDSDYSFIIKEKEGFIMIVRAKYGTTTTVEDNGRR